MTREYLANIDSLFLHMDDPTNPMIITGVMVFDSPINFERLQATVQERLLRIRRFRQRLAWPCLGQRPYWQDDADFDLAYHLQRARLGPPGDQAALQDTVSLLTSTPLDRSRPLWQFHLLENYADCCALVMRFHHCLADGMALVQVMLSLTDTEPNTPWPVIQPQQRQAQRSGSAPTRIEKIVRRAAGAARHGIEALSDPDQLRGLGRNGQEAAADLGRFLLLRPDPQTALRGNLSGHKRAAWSEGIPLDEIKAIRQALGGTVNDVLLAVVAGALRRYMQERGDPVDRLSIRATVPVSMRTLEQAAALGNRVGAVFVSLPIGIADPICRLGEIVRRMNERKGSWEAPVFYFALNTLSYTPPRLANLLINTFGTRATLVMTNVKGPQERLYLAGAPLDGLMAWVPTTGRMGVGVSILSYAGQVRLGVLTDRQIVPDPETIIAAFHTEFEEILETLFKHDARANK